MPELGALETLRIRRASFATLGRTPHQEIRYL
jgi:hypothetical protein